MSAAWVDAQHRGKGMRRVVAALAVIGLGVGVAPAVSAAPVPANCEVRPWGLLGSQTRQICDGPIQADGSWMRERIIGVPAHYVNASSKCSSSSYSSNCTFYPAGWVEDRIASDETYPVTVDTVLPDEPGHLP